MITDEIRKKMALRDPCCPGCPGWCPTDFGTVARCDECFAGVDDAPTDDDVALLPEAQAALARTLETDGEPETLVDTEPARDAVILAAQAHALKLAPGDPLVVALDELRRAEAARAASEGRRYAERSDFEATLRSMPAD